MTVVALWCKIKLLYFKGMTIMTEAVDTEKATKNNKLNLVPNEVIGYRIYPDQWNWTVVVLKKHGKESKHAGQEYATPMAYTKDIRSSISYIMRTVSAIEGRKDQDASFEENGKMADFAPLLRAFEKAEKCALDAVDDLEKRLKDKGYDLSKLSKDLTEIEDKQAD